MRKGRRRSRDEWKEGVTRRRRWREEEVEGGGRGRRTNEEKTWRRGTKRGWNIKAGCPVSVPSGHCSDDVVIITCERFRGGRFLQGKDCHAFTQFLHPILSNKKC